MVVSDFAVGSQVGYFSGSKSEVIDIARAFDVVEKRFSRRDAADHVTVAMQYSREVGNVVSALVGCFQSNVVLQEELSFCAIARSVAVSSDRVDESDKCREVALVGNVDSRFRQRV